MKKDTPRERAAKLAVTGGDKPKRRKRRVAGVPEIQAIFRAQPRTIPTRVRAVFSGGLPGHGKRR